MNNKLIQEKLSKIFLRNGHNYQPPSWMLDAIEELMEESFKAGRTHVWDDYDSPKYSEFEDYLKNTNNDTTRN